MDADVRELFARSVGDAVDKHRKTALDAALVDLGWPDALRADSRDAVSILFERQGAANSTSSAIEVVVLDTLGVAAPGVVLSASGRAPGAVDGTRVIVDGLVFAHHDHVFVVATADEKEIGAIVSTRGLEVVPVSGVDADLGLLRMRGDVDAAGAEAVDWAAGVAAGQRALAHELIGASRTMLRLARDHALDRVQFDRPIAMFQAIRHRLAETLVAIETADAAAEAAWIDGSPAAAAMAKALAGRGARTTARHGQQVLAGIGFTTEHPLHRYIRRVLALDQLLGSSTVLTRELGETLLATRRLPPQLRL